VNQLKAMDMGSTIGITTIQRKRVVEIHSIGFTSNKVATNMMGFTTTKFRSVSGSRRSCTSGEGVAAPLDAAEFAASALAFTTINDSLPSQEWPPRWKSTAYGPLLARREHAEVRVGCSGAAMLTSADERSAAGAISVWNLRDFRKSSLFLEADTLLKEKSSEN